MKKQHPTSNIQHSTSRPDDVEVLPPSKAVKFMKSLGDALVAVNEVELTRLEMMNALHMCNMIHERLVDKA